MTIYQILDILLAILTLIVWGVATYFKDSSRLFSQATTFIQEAEKAYPAVHSGNMKMRYVVGRLYGLVPPPMRPFIPECLIQSLAQKIFDQVAAYAQAQIEKSTRLSAHSTLPDGALLQEANEPKAKQDMP